MPPHWLNSRPSLLSPRECDGSLILLEDSRLPANLDALCAEVLL